MSTELQELSTVVFLIVLPDGKETEISLVECLKETSTTAYARDFDYDLFRNKLQEYFDIDPNVPLLPEQNDPPIEHVRTWNIFLSRVQRKIYDHPLKKVQAILTVAQKEHTGTDEPPTDPDQAESPPPTTPSPTNKGKGKAESPPPTTPSPNDKGKGKAPGTTQSDSTTPKRSSSPPEPDSSKEPSPSNPDAEESDPAESDPEETNPLIEPSFVDISTIVESESSSDGEDNVGGGPGVEIAEAIIRGTDANHPPDWDRVKELFQITDDAATYRMSGLKLDLKQYQLYAIWRMATQPVRNLSSIILGDDVGLGKTAMSIALMLLIHQLQIALMEVRRDWEFPRPPGQERHLAQDGQVPGFFSSICPTQGTSRFSFQCPCVRSGQSYQIARRVASLPFLVVCPAESIRTWVDEIQKWMDFDRPGTATTINNMKFYVAHHSFEKETALEKNPRFFADTAAQDVRPTWREGFCRADRARLLTQHAIICTPQGITALDNKVKIITTGSAPSPSLVLSMMIMDEFHAYKGTRNNETNAFRFLRQSSERCYRPTLAVGLSASAISEGPACWRYLVRHAWNEREAAFVAPGSRELGPILSTLPTLDDFDHWETDWAYVIKNEGLGLSDRVTEQLTIRRKDTTTRLEEFIPAFMICRKRQDNFRGIPISTFTQPAVRHVTCPMQRGLHRDEFSRLASQISAWIDDSFSNRKKEWERNKREGEEPTFASVQDDLLNYTLARNSKMVDAYDILIRAATFPEIVPLYLEQKFTRVEVLSENVARVGKLISAALSPGNDGRSANRNQIQRAVFDTLKEHFIFWEYRDRLTASSSKLTEQIRLIENMREERKRLLPPPRGTSRELPDHTNIRHMLIFTDTPISAQLTFAMLYNKYEETFEWIYIHSGMTPAERSAALARINLPCRPNDRNKIVVSNYPLGAKGINLQRANHVIISEVLRTSEAQTQAFGRVARQGQQFEPVLVQLVDPRNLSELVRIRRNANRDTLAELGHDISIPLDLNDF